jgi:argininosuccinate synthase
MEKIVMAYSGGLDTTAALHWLKRAKAYRVVALALNIGQGDDFDEIAERAIAAGADSVHAIDRRRSFVKQYCFKALRAGARYEGAYYLSAALSRPLIATELVALAREEGARYIAHGAPPRGNDQFRFECAVAALDPELETIAPMREWGLRTHADIREYVKQHRLTTALDADAVSSVDRNLWGTRISSPETDDPGKAPPRHLFMITANPEDGPDTPEEIEITFQRGEPVALNGKRLGPVELVQALEGAAGRHGIGRIDTMEDRILGFKARELYEAPAAHVLHIALAEIERLTLDAELLELKPLLSNRYARLVYDSQWFTKLRESLDAYFRESHQQVSGEVKLQLYKGGVHVLGRRSEFSIYDREASVRSRDVGVSSKSVAGFLELKRLNQMTHDFKQRPKL